MVTISHFHTLPPTIFCQLAKRSNCADEWTWWRHHRNANSVFGYLSVILAPFGTVFGYFCLKQSGNPVHNRCHLLNMTRFTDRDPTGFCNSEPDPDRTGFRKNSTGSDMDIQTAVITAVKGLIKVFFGFKPDWVEYLGRSTGLGSGRIAQWKFWTGLGLQKSPICSTLTGGIPPWRTDCGMRIFILSYELNRKNGEALISPSSESEWAIEGGFQISDNRYNLAYCSCVFRIDTRKSSIGGLCVCAGVFTFNICVAGAWQSQWHSNLTKIPLFNL